MVLHVVCVCRLAVCRSQVRKQRANKNHRSFARCGPVHVFMHVFSVVGAFYYLRVVKLMYFDAPKDEGRVEAAAGLRWVLSANALVVLALGLMPGWLLQVCVSVLPG